jgi:hypothetical protein
MLALDQSRIPPGRSMRFTSSAVNGAHFARQAQKSSASLPNASACTGALAFNPQRIATQTAHFTHQQSALIAAMITSVVRVCHLKSTFVSVNWIL